MITLTLEMNTLKFQPKEHQRAADLYLMRLLQLLQSNPKALNVYQPQEEPFSYSIATTNDFETISRYCSEYLFGHLVILSATLECHQTSKKIQLYSSLNEYCRHHYFKAQERNTSLDPR